MLRNHAIFATEAGPRACGGGTIHDTWWRAISGRHEHGHGRHGGGGGFGPRGGSPFGWGPPGFGPGPGGGGFRRGRKARRGDVRTAALLLLAEQSLNGYQIMQELEERSDGAWRPSAGSVYPALQQLEDEGLIRTEEAEGRKLLHLTDAGRKVVEERGEDEPTPWEQMAGDVSDESRAIMSTLREVLTAFSQVMDSGSATQRAEARELLAGVRRDLYRMLADGDSGR